MHSVLTHAEAVELKRRIEAPKPPRAITMSSSRWIDIPDNPRQRDTERHARRAKYLRAGTSLTHAVVHMAELPDSRRFKLDGHTRAYIWAKSPHLAPPSVTVIVYQCRDIDEVKELYTHFDNPAAAENALDRATGAMRENGINLETPMLRLGKFTSGLRFANKAIGGAARDDLYEVVGLWKKELELFDRVHPEAHTFVAGIVAAALLTFRKHGEKAIPFWILFAAKKGEKVGGLSDGVQALLEFLMKQRGTGKLSGPEAHEEVCSKAISAFETYRARKRYKGGLKPTALDTYI
jgi:hypothetical protein